MPFGCGLLHVAYQQRVPLDGIADAVRGIGAAGCDVRCWSLDLQASAEDAGYKHAVTHAGQPQAVTR